MKILLFHLFSAIIFNSYKTTDAPERYLQKLLAWLDDIKSDAYYESALSWQCGNTVPTVTNFRFVRGFDNATDTTIGAIFMQSDGKNSKQADFYYDGEIRYLIYPNVKGMVIDNRSLEKYSTATIRKLLHLKSVKP